MEITSMDGDAIEPPITGTEKPLLSGPKRQHYLPKFYLEGFTRNGKLAVFDRDADEIRVQQPINTGVIGHFYTFEDAEGRKRYELEQVLSDFESKAKTSIDKLSAKKDISPDERADLAIFVALGGFRTPDIIDSLKLSHGTLLKRIAKTMFQDTDQVLEGMRGKPWAPETEEELLIEARAMVNLVQEDQIEITTSHQWAVGMAIQMALSVAPLLAGRDWIICHRNSEKKSFITTDSPVLLTTTAPRENSFWGVGYGNSDALIAFPLTQSCALLMHGSDGGFQQKTFSTDQIRYFNLSLADRCQRYVIGRDQDLVSSMAKHRNLANKKWIPKIQTS